MKKIFMICFLNIKLIYIFLTLFISVHCPQSINEHRSEIKLVIKGPGFFNYLSDSFYLKSSEVIVNGESITSIIKAVNLKMV